MRTIGLISSILDVYTATTWTNDVTDISAELLLKQENALSVLYQEVVSHSPIGCTMMYAGTALPYGWLWCDGAAYSTTTYSDLYAVIGTTYGSGTGTFNVPDLRALFPRLNDDGKGYDSSRTLGSYQADANKNHQHDAVDTQGTTSGSPYQSGTQCWITGGTVNNQTTSATGGDGHPKNIAMGYIIKYK